ncbi:MAG: YciI family protein [Archangium sp.]
MRFIVLVKGVQESHDGRKPTLEDVAEMGKFNDQLMKAGVMLSAEGLTPSKEGARLNWGKGGTTTTVDGPFAETKELVAGFWIIEAKSRAEAIEWMRRAPFPEGSQLEIRRIAEPSDFADDAQEEIAREQKKYAEHAKKNARA